jgi:hypothetical protein
LVAGHTRRTAQRYWPPAAAPYPPRSRHLADGHAGQAPVHFPCRSSTHFLAGTLTKVDHHGTQIGALRDLSPGDTSTAAGTAT